MIARRIDDVFHVNCLWCGESDLFCGRAILDGDRKEGDVAVSGIARCPMCRLDTKFVKKVGEPPILMPGAPDGWIEVPEK